MRYGVAMLCIGRADGSEPLPLRFDKNIQPGDQIGHLGGILAPLQLISGERSHDE